MVDPGKFGKSRKFHKSNFDEALSFIVPDQYKLDDYNLSGQDLDPVDKLINSHLNILNIVDTVFNISALEGVGEFSGLGTPSGMAQYFVKQNDILDLDIAEFEKRILVPLNYTFNNFDSKEEFADYLENDLLPGIYLNKPTKIFVEDNTDTSAQHAYLVDQLSWIYFLNLSGPDTLDYQPSSYVKTLLTEKLYEGEKILINDTMKGVTEYIWKNYATCDAFRDNDLIPDEYLPPPYIANTENTSGTQQLDKLKTLVDVLYSPLYIDKDDFRLKDAIDRFLNLSVYIDNKKIIGPVSKIVKAFSFAFADYSNSVDQIETYYQIQQCPEEYLPFVADLIGWPLFGEDPGRWRLQLINAVEVYKRAGTKASLQYASDAIFSQNVFDVSSRISDLWESYIPHIIWYSLATESTLFKDYTTWTRDLAFRREFGVNAFNQEDFDENIKLATDRIIFDLVQEFSGSFLLAGEPFPIDDEDFKFKYRGRVYPIPPFEEYPYYVNVSLTKDMIDRIADKLVCFGVPQNFAIQVRDYIKSHTIENIEDSGVNNGWLFFTDDVTYPPNWENIIKDISNKKVNYLSLWNGKSSHFDLVFEADEFDFLKNTIEVNSGRAVQLASQAVKEFSPAHSIPRIRLNASDSDYQEYTPDIIPFVDFKKNDNPESSLDGSSSFTNLSVTGVYSMNGYKRGLNEDGNVFGRTDVDSFWKDLRVSSPNNTTLFNVPRRTYRRRDYSNFFPKEGFYTRDGFNSPSNWSLSSMTAPLGNNILSGAALGLIPSSLTFVTIPDYRDIPPIYRACETLDSANVYYEIAVSNTFPFRGWKSPTSLEAYESDYSCDRGQLHTIGAIFHKIEEDRKLAKGHIYLSSNYDSLVKDLYWKNIAQSYANELTESSGAFPEAPEDFYRVALGREFHWMYDVYTSDFSGHRLNPRTLELDGGPTIFNHAFGSILRNSDFTSDGPGQKAAGNLISNTYLYSGVHSFHPGEEPFADTAASKSLGTHIFTSASDEIVVNNPEYRCSGILDSVELIHTSGSNPLNSFIVFRTEKSDAPGAGRANDFLNSNTIIWQIAQDGFPRISFDVDKFENFTEDGYDVEKNFLLPDHDFNFSFNALVTHPGGIEYGGGTIGVWIHTKEEGGKIWSYTKDKKWVRHDSGKALERGVLNSNDVIRKYSHLFTFNPEEFSYDDPERQGFQCLDIIDPEAQLPRRYELITIFGESDYKKLSVKFNTRNVEVDMDYDYFNTFGYLHRKDQKYVIEVFKVPVDEYLYRVALYHSMDLYDITLNKWCKPLLGGIDKSHPMTYNYCTEFRHDISKIDLMNILGWFNQIIGKYNKQPIASRDYSKMEDIHESKGGSRHNYRIDPRVTTTADTTDYIGTIGITETIIIE